MRTRVLISLVTVAVTLMTLPDVWLAAQPAGDATGAVMAATDRFLRTLTPSQWERTTFDYSAPGKRTWHNGPPTMNPRLGVPLREFTAEQREAAMRVLSSVLSPYGYRKVLDIMDADRYFGANMGAGFPTGPDAYSLAIFGTPSRSQPWMIQFNGHHLGLNVTIVGASTVMSPSLTGAYPASFTRDGRTIRPMGDETNAAFKLVTALTRAQREHAIQNVAAGDLVLGPGQDGKVIEPAGLKASAMTSGQRAMLLDLMRTWINIVNGAAAAAKTAEVTANLNETYFAWSGGTEAGSSSYFRVQGPTVLIEYAPQVNPGGGGRGRGGPQGGRDPNHLHTIFRDFTNDYGCRHAPN